MALFRSDMRGATGVPAPIWRVMQFATLAARRPCPDIDARLRSIVRSDAQWELLERLPAFDRAHHLRVRERLEADGHDDPDLLLAATLHDVGKADERGRVSAMHRVATVLLGRFSPGLLEKAARWDNVIGHGLYLAVHHPALGAVLARQAGASERCCELIARHHDDQSTVDDADLRALIEADEGTLA